MLESQLAESRYLATYNKIVETFRDEIMNYIMVESPYHTDHGFGHSSRIIEYFNKILEPRDDYLNSTETFLLLASAWFHDIGMMINRRGGSKLTLDDIRDLHHVLSKEFVQKRYALFGIRNMHVGDYVAKIIYCHRRKVDISTVFARQPQSITLEGDTIRPRLLAALLRLADALDCDARRAPEILSNEIRGLPRESQKHWRACQLISGVSVDHSHECIVISAAKETFADIELLEWKVRDLFDELATVVDILSQEGELHISNILGTVTDRQTNEVTQVNARTLLKEYQERKTQDGNYKNRFWKELQRVWSQKSSLSAKVNLSNKVYNKYLRYPFTEDVTSRIVVVYRRYLVRYYKNGLSKVWNTFVLANVSNAGVDHYKHMIGGVVPTKDNALRLRCVDADTGKKCRTRITRGSLNKKEVRISFDSIPPRKTRTIRMKYVWKYPKPLRGLRWNNIIVDRVVNELEAEFAFPSGHEPRQIRVFEEKQPWVKEEKKAGITMDRKNRRVTFRKMFPLPDATYNVNVFIT